MLISFSAFVSPVMAITDVVLSPTDINVLEGESFNIFVSINPQEIKNYTIKMELDFPADLLRVESFEFTDNWLALPEIGYDLIDNNNGKLIKTAGYPGGISAKDNFGVISFVALKTGEGVVKTGDNSLALDMDNRNVIDKKGEISFNIESRPIVLLSTEPIESLETETITEEEQEIVDDVKTGEEIDLLEDEVLTDKEEEEFIESHQLSFKEDFSQDGLLANLYFIWSEVNNSLFAFFTIILGIIILLIIGIREFNLYRNK